MKPNDSKDKLFNELRSTYLYYSMHTAEYCDTIVIAMLMLGVIMAHDEEYFNAVLDSCVSAHEKARGNLYESSRKESN